MGSVREYVGGVGGLWGGFGVDLGCEETMGLGRTVGMGGTMWGCSPPPTHIAQPPQATVAVAEATVGVFMPTSGRDPQQCGNISD